MGDWKQAPFEQLRKKWKSAGVSDKDIRSRLLEIERELDEHQKPSDVFAYRLRETRRSRHLSQAELARLMTEAGYPMTKLVVLRIESGDRKVSVDEVFAFAWVLRAVPSQVFSPIDGEYVFPTAWEGLNGVELRNWLMLGDPYLVTKTGRRAKAILQVSASAERLAQALVDARRGKDQQGTNDALKAILELVLKHSNEIKTLR